MTRVFFVGGNWKCNGSVSSIKSLVKAFNEANLPPKDKVEIVVAPPAVHLSLVFSEISQRMKVSAQNCYFEAKGAFTGEISPDMIKDLGLEWVILGHSERRVLFHETEQELGKKITNSLAVGLNVIACIGEKLDEREGGKTESVLSTQLQTLKDSIKDWNRVVVAYEPVWAIGTGRTATPDMAQATHLFIRNWIKQNVSESVAASVRIIYGGSVKASNANELATQPDVDGFLVGGASLIAQEFVDICNSVSAKN